MLSPIDSYFLSHPEPIKSCLQFLRELILRQNPDLMEAWKYSMPFYCHRGKMICYLWVHKKHKLPYLGIVEGAKINHPDLIQEKRARMKILLIEPEKDIPIEKVEKILTEVLALYKKHKHDQNKKTPNQPYLEI